MVGEAFDLVDDEVECELAAGRDGAWDRRR